MPLVNRSMVESVRVNRNISIVGFERFRAGSRASPFLWIGPERLCYFKNPESDL
jgi:hypothetical protein